MEKIIFQLLSCLYLYDSGIPVPVCIRKQSRYTGFRRHREVCTKPVYRRATPQGSLRKAGIPASDVLRVNISNDWPLFDLEKLVKVTDYNFHINVVDKLVRPGIESYKDGNRLVLKHIFHCIT